MQFALEISFLIGSIYVAHKKGLSLTLRPSSIAIILLCLICFVVAYGQSPFKEFVFRPLVWLPVALVFTTSVM